MERLEHIRGGHGIHVHSTPQGVTIGRANIPPGSSDPVVSGVRVVEVQSESPDTFYQVKLWVWGPGATGTAFEARGNAGILTNGEVTFAVQDDNGVWTLAIAPYAIWG